MKDTKPKPETPPLSRAGRKMADATLAAAKFTPTSDGKRAIRKFEVHGMAVTESVNATDAMPSGKPAEMPVALAATADSTRAKEQRPETPPLTRQGRKVADATLAAAKFIPSSDGKNVMRKFEVHGVAVTEYIGADRALDTPREKK